MHCRSEHPIAATNPVHGVEPNRPRRRQRRTALVPDTEVSDRRLGELPARLEDAGTTCALSVEFVPGRLFSVSYQLEALGITCKYAEVVAANVLTKLIDSSTT